MLVLQEDRYYPHSFVQDILWATLHKFVEPVMMHWPGKKLREKALETVMQHVHYEDENTRYICIGPVNKVIENYDYLLNIYKSGFLLSFSCRHQGFCYIRRL